VKKIDSNMASKLKVTLRHL